MRLNNYIIRNKNYIKISVEEYEELLKYKNEYDKLVDDSLTLEKFKRFKLISLEEQNEIKEVAKTGKSQRAIATQFNTNVATINKIINNKY